MHRTNPRVGMAGLVLLLASAHLSDLAAQGLPAWRPINPLVSSRSVLGFFPVALPTATWTTELRVDYASLIEVSERETAEVLLDAEVLRAELSVQRRLGRRAHLQVTTGLRGAYDGVLDGALAWYHRRLGIDQAPREERPDDTFGYRIVLPDGTTLTRDRAGTELSDLRVAIGLAHSSNWQTTLVLGVPLSDGETGLGLETVGGGLMTTLRSSPWDRVVLEGSLGAGVASRSGDLTEYQRSVFFSGTAGGRFRFWGSQALYLNFIFHSPVYRGTTTPALDGSDVSLDMGFLLRPGGRGPELLLGLVEDVYGVGPAVDVVLRLGARW